MTDQFWSFPLLTSKKIIVHLAELNMHIPEEVLLEPKQHLEQVTMVLEKLVEITTGITKEEMSQPVFAGLAMLSHPELHDENISFMAFFRAVSKMMKISKIDDFSLTDISDPKRPRLRRQLSAVINFCRFQEERKAWYNDFMAKKEESMAKCKAVQREHDKLMQEIEAIQERHAEKAKVIAELESECSEIDGNISQLNREQVAIREESSKLKQSNHAAKDKVATAAAALRQGEVERERLQGQVVTSPQRIRREMADQKQALEQELADVEQEQRKTADLEKSAQSAQKANRDLQKAVAGIGEVVTELNKQEATYKEVKLTHRKIVEKKEEYSLRASEVTENQRKLHRYEEKLSHLQKQAVVKAEGMERDLEAVRLSIRQAEDNWKEAAARLKAREPVLTQLKQDKENLQNTLDLQKGEAEQLLEEVGRICRRHSQRLVSTMKERSAPSSTVMA